MSNACTNDGCRCTPNDAIECHATTCAHHCKGVDRCGLHNICIGTMDAADRSTDCKNYCSC